MPGRNVRSGARPEEVNVMFYIECSEYRTGPFLVREHAEQAAPRLHCPLEHTVVESEAKLPTGSLFDHLARIAELVSA